MILLVVLIFLFVFTLLALGVFEASLLQIKTAQNLKSKIFAFQQAETALCIAEKSIIQNQLLGQKTVLYSYDIQVKECMKNFCRYEINAKGFDNKKITELQEIFSVERIRDGNEKEFVRYYREIWREK